MANGKQTFIKCGQDKIYSISVATFTTININQKTLKCIIRLKQKFIRS